MRILVTAYSGFGNGGAEISIYLMCKDLKKRGHEIIFASHGNYKDFKGYKIPRFQKYPIYEIYVKALAKSLTRIIKKENIDIVYPQDLHTTKGAILAAKKNNLPIAVHIRDYWFACPKSSCLKSNLKMCEVCGYKDLINCTKMWRLPWDMQRLAMIKSCWKIFKYVDLFFTGDEPTNRRLRMIGVSPSKCITVNNFRDLDYFKNIKSSKKEFGLDERNKIVLFFGSFTVVKGFDVLLKIVPSILEKNYDCSFILLGQGPGEVSLNDLISKFPNRIKHIKWVDFYKLPSILSLVDVVLFPTIWEEPYGGAQIEAAIAGKAIIASNVGGVRSGHFGFYIKDGNDIELWIKTINEVLKNKKLRAKLGSEARKYALKNFSIKHYNNIIENKLKKISC